MPRTKKPVDLDAKIKERLEANKEKAVHGEIDLGGKTWHLTGSGSVIAAAALFSSSEEDSAEGFLDWMRGMVVEEEQAEFMRLLRRIQGLDSELLSEIANAMAEELTDRPTAPSSRSLATSTSPTSGTRSTENSPLEATKPSTEEDGLTL